MIALVARMKAKPGFEAALAEGCRAMAKKARENEEGCLMYNPYVSVEDPSELVIVEKYADEEALDFHMETPYFKEAMVKLKDVLIGPLDVEKYRPE